MVLHAVAGKRPDSGRAAADFPCLRRRRVCCRHEAIDGRRRAPRSRRTRSSATNDPLRSDPLDRSRYRVARVRGIQRRAAQRVRSGGAIGLLDAAAAARAGSDDRSVGPRVRGSRWRRRARWGRRGAHPDAVSSGRAGRPGGIRSSGTRRRKRRRRRVVRLRRTTRAVTGRSSSHARRSPLRARGPRECRCRRRGRPAGGSRNEDVRPRPRARTH